MDLPEGYYTRIEKVPVRIKGTPTFEVEIKQVFCKGCGCQVDPDKIDFHTRYCTGLEGNRLQADRLARLMERAAALPSIPLDEPGQRDAERAREM